MQAFFHQPYHTDSLNPKNGGLEDDVPFSSVKFCSGSIPFHFRWKITEPATVGLLHCRGCENSLNCERWEWEPCCRGLGLEDPVGCLLKAVSKKCNPPKKDMEWNGNEAKGDNLVCWELLRCGKKVVECRILRVGIQVSMSFELWMSVDARWNFSSPQLQMVLPPQGNCCRSPGRLCTHLGCR